MIRRGPRPVHHFVSFILSGLSDTKEVGFRTKFGIVTFIFQEVRCQNRTFHKLILTFLISEIFIKVYFFFFFFFETVKVREAESSGKKVWHL